MDDIELKIATDYAIQSLKYMEASDYALVLQLWQQYSEEGFFGTEKKI